MTKPVNSYHGTWDQVSPSFFQENKGKLLIISGVALLAIATGLGGGFLLIFKVNTIAAWSLIATGGALVVGDLVGGVILFIRHRKKEKSEESSYHIVSWNVAVLADYANMCSLKHKLGDGKDLATAYEETKSAWPGYLVSKEEKKERVQLFQQAFRQFGDPDIICLQESWQMKAEDLQAILPKGYSHFTYERTVDDDIRKDCTVIWKESRFSKINHAHVLYQKPYIDRPSPDTIVLLKDEQNGTTLCVDSAHLIGFSLAYKTLEPKFRKEELAKAEMGDRQTNYDLHTMSRVNADLYLFAGDFNVTPEQKRLRILEKHGYITDETDKEPTIYDANLKEEDGRTPKPAKLDYIYAKGRKGSHVSIKSEPLERTPLEDCKRPSDHLPVSARVTYSLKG